MASGYGFAVRLEWRLRRGHEEQPVEAELFYRRLRDEQMAGMDQVKRTAVNSKFHVARCKLQVKPSDGASPTCNFQQHLRTPLNFASVTCT